MAEVKEIAARLAEPFPAADIEWRVGSTNRKDNPTSGIALAYITNRAVQQRLDDVVGIDNWRNEYQLWRNNGVLCGLSIRINGEWITKWDGSDESDMEAIKGGLSDAMKRSAYQWGIGRYLYNLPTEWVPVEKRGRTTVLKQPPRLPDWALPEAERGKKNPTRSPQPPTNTNASAGTSSPSRPPPQSNKPPEMLARDQDIAAVLAERKKHENGWAPILDLLKKKGMPDGEGLSNEEKQALLDQHMKQITVTEANDLLRAIRALPYKSASKPQEGG